MIREDLIQAVKVKLEELSPFNYDKKNMIALGAEDPTGELIAQGDPQLEINPIYTYIDKSLDSSANEVLKTIPLQLISPREWKETKDTPLDAIPTMDGKYWIQVFTMPTDYLRVHTVKMDDWVRYLTEAGRDDSDAGIEAGNIWNMGKPTRPRAIEDWAGGRRTVRCYSSRAEIQIDPIFRYVPKFETSDVVNGVEGDPEGNSDRLWNFYALMTAMNICLIYGNENGYNQLSKEYQLILEANK